MSSTPVGLTRRFPCCGAEFAQLVHVRLYGPDVAVRELLRW